MWFRCFGQDTAARRNSLWHLMTCSNVDVFDLCIAAEEDKEEDHLFAECHAANLANCENMYRQNARSKVEEDKFNCISWPITISET